MYNRIKPVNDHPSGCGETLVYCRVASVHLSVCVSVSVDYSTGLLGINVEGGYALRCCSVKVCRQPGFEHFQAYAVLGVCG